MVVTLWTLLNYLIVSTTIDSPTEPDAAIVGWSIAGVLSGWAFVFGYLVFANRPSGEASPYELKADRRLRFLTFSLFLLMPLIIISSQNWRHFGEIIAVHLLLMIGIYSVLWFARYYVGLLLFKPFQPETICRIDFRVSIGSLLTKTGLLAIFLTVCRYFFSDVGDLSAGAIAMGTVAGLNWMLISLWILGKYYLLPLVLFIVLVEFVCVIFFFDQNLDILIPMLASLKAHFILFLSILRAAEFRFSRVRFSS